MVVQLSKNKRRQRILLVVLIVIIIITVLIWLFGFSRSKKPALVAPPVLVLVKEIKINFELLRDPRLKEFRPFQEIPPFGMEPGRDNPFLSY